MRLSFLLFFFLQSAFSGLYSETHLISGKLDNGLTYYVKENETPKGKAFMQLIVKVGSIHEEEHEQGIAHFLEHLNFRGSKHFPDGELDRYLHSIGSAEHNAMTGFDTTTYYLNIPIDKEGNFDTALLFLHDFAGFASLKEEAIAKERHVVLDEMHQGAASPGKRHYQRLVNENFPGSLLGSRFPIGTEEVISAVSPETLRTFYKKWYRPDRMAVILVGDFDGHDVEKKVQKLFGDIVNPEVEVSAPDLGLKFPSIDRQSFYFDPDLGHTSFTLNFSIPSEENKNLSDREKIKKGEMTHAFLELFSDRLALLKDEGVLSHGKVGITAIPSVLEGYIEADFFENKIEEGLQAVQYELNRLKAFGFTQEELEAWKERELIRIEVDRANVGTRPHQSFVTIFNNHFLDDEGYLPESEQDAFSEEVIQAMTVNDLNQAFIDSPFTKPVLAFFSTSSPEVKEQIEGKDLLLLAQPIKELVPFTYKKVDLQINTAKTMGQIIEKKLDENTGVAEWILSNGIKVLVKKTDLERERIHLTAVARGGLSQFSEEDLPSAAFVGWGLDNLKGLSYSETKRFFNSKDIETHVDLSGGYRSLSYSVNMKNLEPVFQVAHTVFTEPSFSKKSWERRIALFKEGERQAITSRASLFGRFVDKVTTDDHFYFRDIDLEKVHPKKAIKAFNALFGNPGDFTFILVGDFDEKRAEELVKTYIASLPTAGKKNKSAFLVPSPLQQELREFEFISGQQSFANCELVFSIDLEAIRNRYHSLVPANSIVHILKDRLWKVLREKHGKTYGVKVNLFTPFSPSLAFSQLKIEFTCQPADRRFMVDLALQEVEKIQHSLPTAEEMTHLKASYHENQKGEKLSNDYWMGGLIFAELHGIHQNDIFDDEKKERLLTPVGVEEVAMNLFDHTNASIFYHLPHTESR